MKNEKENLIHLLSGNINADHIFHHQDWLIQTIPEIKPMLGMEQHNPNHCFTVWEHTVHSIVFTPDNPILRLTMLFHDIGKPACYHRDENGIGHFYGHPKESCHIASAVLKRLSFGIDIANKIDTLIFYHDAHIPSKATSVRKWMNKIGNEAFALLLDVKRADTKAQAKAVQNKKLMQIDRLEQKWKELIEADQHFQKKDLAITGFDLINIGIPQGKEIASLLSQLVLLVRENKLENEKKQLLEKAQQLSSSLS